MKVTVAKTPGSRAVAVEIVEGGTVLDALAAANMSESLDQGFEVRVGFEPAQLTDVLANNSIVTLTAKVKGNAPRVVHIAGDNSEVEPATFVLEKVTNSKSIFSNAEIQAYILSATDAVGDLILESWNAAIFGENEDGSFTMIKDRPLNNGTFLTTAPTLYCVVHGPTWDGDGKDVNFLADKYFQMTNEALEEACEGVPETVSNHVEDACNQIECSCDNDSARGDNCSCGYACDCVDENMGSAMHDIPKTIHVNLTPQENESTATSQLQKIASLIEELRKVSRENNCAVDLDINVHIHTN